MYFSKFLRKWHDLTGTCDKSNDIYLYMGNG